MTSVSDDEGAAAAADDGSDAGRDPREEPDGDALGGSAVLAESRPVARVTIREDYAARGEPVVALERLTPPKHRQRFQNTALKAITSLIIFFTVVTMGTALLATFIGQEDVRQTVATLASDIAKSAIPTLIALLGTAAAWAFKDSGKDE